MNLSNFKINFFTSSLFIISSKDILLSISLISLCSTKYKIIAIDLSLFSKNSYDMNNSIFNSIIILSVIIFGLNNLDFMIKLLLNPPIILM